MGNECHFSSVARCHSADRKGSESPAAEDQLRNIHDDERQQ